jgi:cytochrome c1
MLVMTLHARHAAILGALALAVTACGPSATPSAPTSSSAAPTAAPAATKPPAAPSAAPASPSPSAAAAAPSPSAASKPAAPAAAAPDPAQVQAGQQLVAAKGCGGCHAIPGVAGASGTIGPNLAGIATRTKIAGGAVDNNGPDDLKKWLLNPPALKPGTAMPNLGLTDDEATKITAFLETLK